MGSLGHTLYGCVDWNLPEVKLTCSSWGHTLYGCVDWNGLYKNQRDQYDGHTLYGCVDWNTCLGDTLYTQTGSHPVWVCGLKHWQLRFYLHHPESHPVWVCGLKHQWSEQANAGVSVTPCMGVWIETSRWLSHWAAWSSHPVWVCGLKPFCAEKTAAQTASHPVWVCGLKLADNGDGTAMISHTLYGCVDWNLSSCSKESLDGGHTLYGCVDWNLRRSAPTGCQVQSHPVWVCGLKLLQGIIYRHGVLSHPVWVCGLKQDKSS